MKVVNINKTVFELTQNYPELIDILADFGLLGVKNPIIRSTIGRITTLKQGIEKQGKNLNEIIRSLSQKGFKVVDE